MLKSLCVGRGGGGGGGEGEEGNECECVQATPQANASACLALTNIAVQTLQRCGQHSLTKTAVTVTITRRVLLHYRQY